MSVDVYERDHRIIELTERLRECEQEKRAKEDQLRLIDNAWREVLVTTAATRSDSRKNAMEAHTGAVAKLSSRVKALEDDAIARSLQVELLQKKLRLMAEDLSAKEATIAGLKESLFGAHNDAPNREFAEEDHRANDRRQTPTSSDPRKYQTSYPPSNYPEARRPQLQPLPDGRPQNTTPTSEERPVHPSYQNAGSLPIARDGRSAFQPVNSKAEPDRPFASRNGGPLRSDFPFNEPRTTAYDSPPPVADFSQRRASTSYVPETRYGVPSSNYYGGPCIYDLRIEGDRPYHGRKLIAKGRVPQGMEDQLSIQWYRSPSFSDHFLKIPEARGFSYQPTADDVNTILRVEIVSLRDPHPVPVSAELPSPVEIEPALLRQIDTFVKTGSAEFRVIRLGEPGVPWSVIINKQNVKVKKGRTTLKKTPCGPYIKAQLDVQNPCAFTLFCGDKRDDIFVLAVANRYDRDLLALTVRRFCGTSAPI